MKITSQFHPRMMGLAGFSGCGKTTLIEKLIRALPQYRVGYIKHDAHFFEMDHVGKDTYRQFHAGAQTVLINDATHLALQTKGESYQLEREYFLDCDLIFIEGHKYAKHPKMLFLDSDGLALAEYQAGKITQVVATISNDNTSPVTGLPHFYRDQVTEILDFIFRQFPAQSELRGLILAGGKSQRMGQDKALLTYHGKSQVEHLCELMENLNLQPVLSCRTQQYADQSFPHIPKFEDRFVNFGPLGGILTAMVSDPGKAWLVIACDLPLISLNNIQELISARDAHKQATTFFNLERNQFEPLFTIYEPSIFSRMLYFLGQGQTCPQKVLYNSSIKKISLSAQSFLVNANSPEEMSEIKNKLGATE